MPRPFDLIHTSINLFIKHFWYLFKLWLIVVLLALGSVFLFGLLATLLATANAFSSPYVAIAVGLIAIIALLVLFSWLGGAISVQYAQLVISQSILPLNKLLSQGWAVAGKLLLGSLFSGLIIAFGCLLLIIPGLIFAVWFSFIQPVITHEKASVFVALAKSKQLVSGRFWTVVKYLLIPILIAIVYSIVVSLLLSPLSNSAQKFLFELFTAPIGSISTIYLFLLYKHLAKP